jgi:hypothetical protein
MDYREIARLQQSPVSVRSLARMLLSLEAADYTGRDRAFLGDLARLEDGERMTTAQGEYLIGLRDRGQRKRVVSRHRVHDFLRSIYLAREDLDEDQQEWVETLVSHGPDVAVNERQWRRLCALARQLGLIDDEFIPF